MYDRASRTAETPFAHKTLIRSGATRITRKVTLLSGQTLLAGAVLGLATLGTATAAAKAGGNTGNGAFTMDATTPVLTGAKLGVYTVRCTVAAANGGTFRVEDPDGFVLGEVAVGGTFSDDIKFAVADGATDFVVGDGFDVTVAAGTGKAKLSAAAAVDGTQEPSLVLAYDADASGADLEVIAYEMGDFIQEQLILGTGHTLASIREGLRRRNITFG